MESAPRLTFGRVKGYNKLDRPEQGLWKPGFSRDCKGVLRHMKSQDAISGKELPACPVETTLMLIGDKWKVLILRDLMPGAKRFGELKRSIGGVSQKVLTAQLRDMEANGLVHRQVFAEVPPRVEYSLTGLGRSLKPILDAMWSWGEGYKAQNSR